MYSSEFDINGHGTKAGTGLLFVTPQRSLAGLCVGVNSLQLILDLRVVFGVVISSLLTKYSLKVVAESYLHEVFPSFKDYWGC